MIGLSGPKRLSYRPIIYLICPFQHRPCSTIILLPEEVFQQFLSFIILPKVVHSSYFQKKSFNNSYFILQFLLHLTSERSIFILLPKEVLQQFLSFILLSKEEHSSYFQKKSFNDSSPSSNFPKRQIRLTSETSLPTILTSFYHLTSERSTFILLPKEVFQHFLQFVSLPKEVRSSYFRK